ncbi:MAG: hypothetical protein J6R88_01455 [Clostridia bacterium]|nr:hypothetical protein [Clostridia bacterium]
MDNVAYLNKKQSLKEEYTNDFIKNVDVISKDFGDKVVETLGNEYLLLKDEYFALEEFCEKTKKDFLSSNEYLLIKNEVTLLKSEIDGNNDNDLSELNMALHQKLSKLATLNTTLNNRLKSSRERLNELKKQIFNLFDLHKEKLNEIRLYATKQVTEEIKQSIDSFNEELVKLNEEYGVESTEKEYPFDFDKIELVTVTDKLQSDYFYNDTLDEIDDFEIDDDVVLSENFDEFIN